MRDPEEYIPPILNDVPVATKPRRKRRRRGEPPEPPEPTLDELAEDGRLDELLDRLSSHEGESVSGAGKSRLIRKVLDAVAADGLGAFMEASLSHMLRFSMTQYCKAEVACRQKIRNDEAKYGDKLDPPEKVVTQDLPRLVGITHSVTALVKAAATVRHLERLRRDEAHDATTAPPAAGPVVVRGANTAEIQVSPYSKYILIPRSPEEADRLRRSGWEKISDTEWWRATPIGPNQIAIDSFSVPPEHAAG